MRKTPFMTPSTAKKIVLRIRAVDHRIFDVIRDGSKDVETRAATAKFAEVAPGTILVFVCEGERLEKVIKKFSVFKTVDELLNKYPVKRINPDCATAEELKEMYRGFPGYEEKLKLHGIAVMEI
jgi:ASC-1-like (ASCH) protein